MPELNFGSKKEKKIVVVGGGTGVFTVLSGLKKYPVELSAVISMADDGGSTGVLREEFGILPPGDLRRAMVALARTDNKLLSDLFNYRFREGGFRGHAFGNIMLTALERLTGSFEDAVEEAGRILNVQGRVIPVTLDDVELRAELEDGAIIKGETNIDIPKHDSSLKIKRVFLKPHAAGNPKAISAIKEADLVVLGPGDLFTSIIPNLLVRGIGRAIREAKGTKVFVVNTMTKPGETTNFTARDFLDAIEKYLGKGVLDFVIINTKKPSPERLKEYAREGKRAVGAGSDFQKRPVAITGDFVRKSGFVRHDPARLAETLVSLL